MAVDNRIVAWVKLRDIARFVADAKLAEHSIKKMSDAAKDGEGPFGALGGAISSLQDVLPKAKTETGILGLTLGSLITVIVLGTPIVVGLGGAVVALAGSFGAAALGAGALAVALGGVALAAGPLALVAADMFQGFTKVNTAFGQWQKALSMYGPNSTQAETALSRLNAVAGQFGGPTLISLVQRWNDFMNAFRSANAPAIQNIISMFGVFLDVANKLLPVLSYMSKTVSGALLMAFRQVGAVLTSSGVDAILRRLADAFASLSGPLIHAALNVLLGLLTLADRAAPALSWLVGEVVKLSQAFLDWSSNASIGALVSQFQSWWNLAKALGGLLVTILSGGAKQGQGMVDSLTQIVNKWNAWLKGVQGQKSLRKFFADAVAMTRALMPILAGIIVFFFKFGRMMLPIYTKVFGALRKGFHQLMDALKPFKPFWDNVLGPLLKGFAKGVIGSVVAAFEFLIAILKIAGPIFGWLGEKAKPLKGFFEGLGTVIGWVFGGPILKALGMLGKLSFLLRPLSFLFRVLELPIRAMTGILGFLIGKLASLIGFFGKLAFKAIPLFRDAIGAVVRFLTGAGQKFFNAGVWLWNRLRAGIIRAVGQGIGFAADLGKAVYNFVAKLINKGIPNRLGPINLPNNPIPLLAAGGVVTGTGSWITGDAGPEINSLRNGKVTVVPLTPSVKAQSANATMMPRENRIIVSKIYLRGRQIAEAVADEAEAEAARR